MSDRIAIVTDNSCSLLAHESQHPALRIVDISVLANDRTLLEHDDFISALQQGQKVTTAAPSVAKFVEVYRELVAAGFTQVFSVHISSRLSSTYEHAAQAAQNFSEFIHVVDSRTAGFALGRLVLDLLAMVDRDASRFEVFNRLDNFFPDEVLLLPQSMDTLKQGGRVQAGAAMVAQLFQIVPWGKISEGKLVYAGRAKSFEAALNAILQTEVNHQNGRRSVVLQIDNSKYEELVTRYPQLQKLVQDYQVRDIPPVLLAHTGLGAIGLVLER